MQHMQLMQPQSQMQHIPANNQFQPSIQQFQYQPQVPNFQPPPQMQHIQQQPFQNLCPPGHQIQYPPSNQQFLPQPLPPVNISHVSLFYIVARYLMFDFANYHHLQYFKIKFHSNYQEFGHQFQSFNQPSFSYSA